MRPFDYASPRSVDEAVALLAAARPDGDGPVRALAGGTDLLTLMKADVAAPARVVDIKRSGLAATVEETTDGVVIGALATLAQLETSRIVRARYPALAEAAAVAATPQLRNVATIAGNLLQRPRCWYFRNRHVSCWLKGGDDCPARDGENQLHALFGGGPCWAVHPSDLAPALVAHDAEVRLRGPRGERTLPVADVFSLPEERRRRETALDDDELVVSLRLPPARESRSTYVKAMDRHAWAFALAGVAARVALDGARVADARIVLAGVAPIPWRVQRAEEAVVGAELTPAVRERAAAGAVLGAQPLRANGYKIALTGTLVRRALEGLATSSARD